ncbi:AAA family ATPase [Thalassolituus sp. UBA1505]|uniref:AAA family ATPase n=2 Tax=unclassified Thalassolituus TaxID=2624967 RepID=UPI0025DEE1A2|nr:AAA family ATPase [Thalassolituus sp. UBA1505]|tara:strand:- start:4112 stop:6715 length:2604 start_codon:yes stop_codon:yes gene_type:complete
MVENVDSNTREAIAPAELEALWDEFLRIWPLERLVSMTLAEYTSQGTDDSFCYWLESATDKLGSIWGGSAFKFGVYARKDKIAKENSGGRCYNDDYGWMAKYGDTAEEAFSSVRNEIIKVAKAARNGDLHAVQAADLGEAIRWKIAFLYQDRSHITVLPIFSGAMLSALTGKSAKSERLIAHEMLMDQLGDRNIFEHSYNLLKAADSLMKADFDVSKAQAYFDESDEFQAIKPSTQYVAGYETIGGKQIALIKQNKKVTLFMQPGDWLPTVKTKISSLKEYTADEPRNSNLGANAPTLAAGNPAVSVIVESLDDLKAVCSAYDSEVTNAEIDSDPENRTEVSVSSSLNQILYGPPGTGKTYATTERAVMLADPAWMADLNAQGLNDVEIRSQVKQRYEQLVTDKRIGFTTFHQSFSYEDFIEGIRAKTDDESGQIDYCVESGVFKEIADRANSNVLNGQSLGLSESPAVWKISIGRRGDKEMRERYIQAGEARIGWNDTGDLSIDVDDREEEQQTYWDSLSYRNHDAINAFVNDIKIGDVLLCLKDVETVQAVGIVTSDYFFDQNAAGSERDYAHVRKVNWLLTDIELSILSLNSGKRMVQQTLYLLPRINWNELVEELQRQDISLPFSLNDSGAEKRNYVLIIDEINRGNISRIFGELITLLEPDKRKGGADERSVILPYSKDSFSVPDNLYVLGTMNTADKSLAQLDLALRRRFEFVEQMPEPKLLAGVSVHGVDIAELMDVLNQRIEVLLDRDHMLGHAYFWPLKTAESDEQREQLLADIFAKRIIPLLQEYFFADWERIGWVLNDSQKPPAARFIELTNVGRSMADLFPQDVAEQISDRRYRINPNAFTDPAAYRGILPGGGA